MEKIAVIGDYESIVIYKTFGWDVFYINLADKTEVIEMFKSVVKEPVYKKIFVVEDVYKILSESYSDFDKEKTIIPLSGVCGTKNISKQKYKNLIAIATSIKLEEL